MQNPIPPMRHSFHETAAALTEEGVFMQFMAPVDAGTGGCEYQYCEPDIWYQRYELPAFLQLFQIWLLPPATLPM